ncbi:MAG: ketoacyl-ACP synthase III [Synergistes sp.]|nr:ketoacyl-ACP synthase III [Synergistes sp.]
MPYFNFSDIAIRGISVAVPKQVVDIKSYIPKFGEENVYKFMAFTGIEKTHVTREEQTASDLGFEAADRLLREKNIDRASVGALIFVTQSPDYKRPATSFVLQHRLGLSQDCAVFDVNLGCSGFVCAFQTACSMMSSSDMKMALVIVAETSSKAMWPNDKSSAMLFGDCGAAVLIERSENAPQIKGGIWSDGDRYRAIIIPAGGARDNSAPHEPFVGRDECEHMPYYQIMNGADVFQFSISDVPKAAKAFFDKTGAAASDYDLFAIHQANWYIVKQLINKLKLAKEKVHRSLDRYGNTGGMSIPLTLCDALGGVQDSSLMHVFMMGFGIGLSWGIVDAFISPDAVLPVLETDAYYKDGIIDYTDI